MAKQESAITKTEAVRQAFEKLGKDAAADAVMGFVKQEYGIDLSRSHLFNIKSTLNKTTGSKRGRPRKATSEPTAASAPAPKVRNAISLDDLHTIKTLAEKYGTQSVRTLIDLVAK